MSFSALYARCGAARRPLLIARTSQGLLAAYFYDINIWLVFMASFSMDLCFSVAQLSPSVTVGPITGTSLE